MVLAMIILMNEFCSSETSRFWPGPMPPDAMPPTAGTPGKLALRRFKYSSIGNE